MKGLGVQIKQICALVESEHTHDSKRFLWKAFRQAICIRSCKLLYAYLSVQHNSSCETRTKCMAYGALSLGCLNEEQNSEALRYAVSRCAAVSDPLARRETQAEAY